MSLIPFAVLWLGLALFTFALGRVASGPMPNPVFADQGRASRGAGNKSRSTSLRL